MKAGDIAKVVLGQALQGNAEMIEKRLKETAKKLCIVADLTPDQEIPQGDEQRIKEIMSYNLEMLFRATETTD